VEFGEVVGGYVGDGAHFHAGFAPIDPVIAELRAGERLGIGFRRGPDEDVDEVLAASVDEHGNGASVDDVEAAALQRKSFIHKIVDRRSEIELAIEPRLYGVLIGRLHIFEMAGLKRTQMRVHDGGSQRGFALIAAQ